MIAKEVLTAYGFTEQTAVIHPYGSGLINNTWRVKTEAGDYILQRINQTVFKHPPDIASNIDLISAYLKRHHPRYFFVTPVSTSNGDGMIEVEQHYFRLFPFVTGSHSIDVVETAEQAYEAAAQFGKFTGLLTDLDVSKLKFTIPRFHDLSLRYQQFHQALQHGNTKRIEASKRTINKLESYRHLLDSFEKIASDKRWRLRVTHHDTKISNVLFDEAEKGICVIDLDTVMPGYFISDVGDMMRTYLSPVSEEEKDFSKIEIREDFYRAIVSGYFEQMQHQLTETERMHFFFAGKFMIYMQALRFLTDHLNDDIYYGAAYPGHNFVRANNQLTLLDRLSGKERSLVDR